MCMHLLLYTVSFVLVNTNDDSRDIVQTDEHYLIDKEQSASIDDSHRVKSNRLKVDL